MSKLSKFFHHHADAIHSIASIFETAFAALPIAPVDREAVTEALDSLRKIGTAVKDAAPEVAKATEVKVSKADIEAAVAPLVETALANLAATAVEKAIAARNVDDGK